MRYDEPIGGGPSRQTERIDANLKRKSEAFIAAGCPGLPFANCEPVRGMKDGESCFMIERAIEGWPHWACWDATNENPFQWTNDPNAALHFADMASCDQICAEMPDSWDVRITGHSWMDNSRPT